MGMLIQWDELKKINESIIIKKVLNYLPLIFNAEVSLIEEIKDLENMTIDELDGILTTCEMRIEKEK